MSHQGKQLPRGGGIALAVLALVVTLTAVFVGINYQSSRGQAAGVKNPARHSQRITIKGQLSGGGKFSTANWKGKVIIVDFWGTWCPWCVREAPAIAKLYAKYHSHGLEVVGISLNDSAAAVRRYLKANPQETWPQLLDSHHHNEAIARHLGIQGLPTEMVIDRHGVLQHTVVGYAPHQLAADVQKLLAVPAH